MINIKEIEKQVLQKFDSGKTSPTGGDGGVLKYGYTGVTSDGKVYQARFSITLDSEIAQVKRIWALSLDDKEVYNLTNEYYKLRK